MFSRCPTELGPRPTSGAKPPTFARGKRHRRDVSRQQSCQHGTDRLSAAVPFMTPD